QIDTDLQDIPGAEVTVSAMDGGMGFGDPITIELNGPEHEVLRELSELVVTEISKVDGIYNPESSSSGGVPQMSIVVDKERAATYGLTPDQITGQVQLQFTGQLATLYMESCREIDVTLMYPEDVRSTISYLEDMKIQTPTGATVPLCELAEFVGVQGPVTLLRQNQQPQINVSSEILDRDLGSIVKDVEQTMENMNLPEGRSEEHTSEIQSRFDI